MRWTMETLNKTGQLNTVTINLLIMSDCTAVCEIHEDFQ